MRIIRFLSCCNILLVLCSCTAEPGEAADIPHQTYNDTVESGSASGIILESESNTSDTANPEPEPSETESMIEPKTETTEDSAETDPLPIVLAPSRVTNPPAETTPPVPPILPDDLHTNLADPDAAFILMEIYEAVSASTDAGVYFTDVEEEYWFGIGEENRYHTASTVKPVYCQYLLSAGTDLETEVTLQQVSRTSSTGKLNWDDIGTTFTVGELIEYSIRYSDNQAHRLLYETFGIEGYNQYVASFGSGGLPMDEEYEWSRVTPKKLSLMMLEIYRYGAENSILIDHLKNTTFNNQIPAGTEYETAHKYGSNGGSDGYHDTAIVYAPERAYVLTIMTHIDTAQTEDEDAVFRRIAELCDELHDVLFTE